MVEGDTAKRTAKPRSAGTAGTPSSPLGERLRRERDRLGLSLRELSRRLGVSPSLVSQIETGKIQPSVRTLYAIVSELGVSLDDVFGTDGGETPRPGRTQPPAGDGASSGEGRAVQRKGGRRVVDLEGGVRW